MRRRLLIVVLFGLALVGCSTGQSEDDGIGDFSEIAESDP
jgi:hypothetical protein